jgi:hypothetical protein
VVFSMDAIIITISTLEIIAGVFLTSIANDTDAGDIAKRLAWFLILAGVAGVFTVLALDNPDNLKTLGYRAVVFCGFGG